MNNHPLIATSKRVSWLLRHGASERGVAMDDAGWVAVADVLRVLRLSPAQLDAVVAQNDKLRFERQGSLIRACQGHSERAVTRGALEASWAEHHGGEPIFHGTSVEAALSIAREGIGAQARSHVHLAPSRRSKVGKRWNVALLLAVDPARVRGHGIRIFASPNGVLLARRVPADCIVGVEPLTGAAQARLHDLRAAFGLGG